MSVPSLRLCVLFEHQSSFFTAAEYLARRSPTGGCRRPRCHSSWCTSPGRCSPEPSISPADEPAMGVGGTPGIVSHYNTHASTTICTRIDEGCISTVGPRFGTYHGFWATVVVRFRYLLYLKRLTEENTSPVAAI